MQVGYVGNPSEGENREGGKKRKLSYGRQAKRHSALGGKKKNPELCCRKGPGGSREISTLSGYHKKTQRREGKRFPP